MKNNFSIADGFRRTLRHNALTATLVAFATLGHAGSSDSPVGTKWDCIMSGSRQDGITVIEFFDNGTNRTFSGYQLLSSTPRTSNDSSAGDPPGRGIGARGDSIANSGANTNSTSTLLGFGSVGGPWDYDSAGRIIGQFIQAVSDGTPTGSTNSGVSFSAKVVAGKRLTMVSSTPNGKVSYRGVPLTVVGDLSGKWNGAKKQDKQTFLEFFTLTPLTNSPNLYAMEGQGPGYIYTNITQTFDVITTNFGTVIITNGGSTIITTNEVYFTNQFTVTNFNWCLVSSQRKIGFAVTELQSTNTQGTDRATFGNFRNSKKSTTAKTKGQSQAVSSAISFDAEKR